MKDQQIIFQNTPGTQNHLITFTKEGQSTQVLGIIVANKPGDYFVNVSSEHIAGFTSGQVILRGICANGAKVTVNGLVKIHPNAQEVNDFLEMKLLVLDKFSQAIAKPELEIEANSVKASHAATVGQIDKEQLFYLTSRGLSEEEAKQMIVKGFVSEVLNKIRDEETRSKLLKMLD